MKTHVEHIDDLLIFLDVVEAGGFNAASRRTGRSLSLISRRIQVLERSLGVSLLVRDSRRCEATDTGRGIAEYAVRIRAEAEAALSFAAHHSEVPTGLLRVSCPVSVATSVVGPLAMDLATLHPQLQIKMSTYNGRMADRDATADIVILPAIGKLKDSEWVARKLVDCRYQLVAAPNLADQYQHLSSPQDFEGIPAVGWTFHDSPATWMFQNPTGLQHAVDVDIRFLADTLPMVGDAALRGLGVAQLPVSSCARYLAEGTLRALSPDWAPPPVSMYAVYPSRRNLTPGGRLFIDLLSQRFQNTPSSVNAP